MKVIYGTGKSKKEFEGVVLAIGVFDGLHRGHQALIKAAVKRARALEVKSAVMTFVPHPLHVLHPEIPLSYIISPSYRLRLIESLGVAACLVIPFTKRFARLRPHQFIKHYLVDPLHPREIFVGNDFRFGENRSGTLEYFREAGRKYGFKVSGFGIVRGDHQKIGSSVIRKLVLEGRLKEARKFLGRDVSLMGKVVRGDGRGRTLGFPTANIHPQGVAMPPRGVYAVRVCVGRRIYRGMANVGQRPSFKKKDAPLNVEVHVLDFNGNLYKKEIIVAFVQRIREEKFFRSKETFIAQLKKDRIRIRKILSRIS